MKKIQLIIIFLILLPLNIISQNDDFKQIVGNLRYIELPFKIESFNKFRTSSSNQFEIFNSLTKEGKGYLNHNSEYKKATKKYPDKFKKRMHERMNNGNYEKYEAKDSIRINFVGLLKISKNYKCILVKIQDIPNNFQKAYYYKILSYNKTGDHVSTIKVFELIDDASTKDWLKEKPTPNAVSTFNSNGSIEVVWDEGYDNEYIQHIKLNNNGVFYVKELEKLEH